MGELQSWQTYQNNQNQEVIAMQTIEGYWNVVPKIKAVSFPKRGKFQVDLQDGRSIIMATSAFPCLKKVPTAERSQWYLMGGGVTWDSCPEVIHIEQILGDYSKYAHEAPMAAVCEEETDYGKEF